MFTGIIEATGIIIEIAEEGSNKTFTVQSAISKDLKIDQSVCHDGVCLTVTDINPEWHRVTAIKETLEVSNLDTKKSGDELNLERCMQMNGRLDGHIVQGHVDSTATCTERKELDGSTEFVFAYDSSFAALMVEKGSVTVNGISLTCFNVTDNTFTVAVIPYTFEHTNIKNVFTEMLVNIEFDIIGKFVQRNLNLKK